MLDGRGHHAPPAGGLGGLEGASDGQIDGLRPAGGQNEILWGPADEPRHGGAGVVEYGLGPLTVAVNRGGIPEILGHRAGHGLHDPGGRRRGGVVVEVNPHDSSHPSSAGSRIRG